MYRFTKLAQCLMLLIFMWGCEMFAQVPGIPGTIAYLKNNQTELHLTEADGNNDRVIWTNPFNFSPFLTGSIDWRPDGQELAFASGHELMSSIYYDDIWAIKPDGSGLRRVTNAPKQSDLVNMPKGSVTVTVMNSVLNTNNIFFLYIDGADSAFQFVLNPGFQVDITMHNVADFGNGWIQRIVVFDASKIWLHSTGVDVQVGQTVTVTTPLNITASGGGNFTALKPKWRHDSSQIAYLLAGNIPQVIDANPPFLNVGGDVFQSGTFFLSTWDWSPVNDDFLVNDAFGSGIYKTQGTTGNTTLLVPGDTASIYGVEWMPDASGFVYSMSGGFQTYANLFHYRISDGQITQLTHFTTSDQIVADDPTVSPDGQWIAYTKIINGNPIQTEIWVLKIDGSQTWRLATDAVFPAWGPGTVNPPPTGGVQIRNFDPQNSQQIVVGAQNGFVHGTNNYHDAAKGTALTLPAGQNSGKISEVKVWFGYKKDGLTNETYTLEIYNGDANSGPTGPPLHSQTFQMANINADADPNTPSDATVHTLSSPVTVGQHFFVVINFGSYSVNLEDAVSIAATQAQGQRIAEDWELWSDGTWHNMSDAWTGNGTPGSGTDGWYMWIEATAQPVTGIEDGSRPGLAEDFELAQNYPNPFNPETTIRFALPQSGKVSLKIYNIAGQLVKTLVDGSLSAGAHQVRWDATSNSGQRVASGVYLYALQHGERRQTRKMMLIR